MFVGIFLIILNFKVTIHEKKSRDSRLKWVHFNFFKHKIYGSRRCDSTSGQESSTTNSSGRYIKINKKTLLGPGFN